MSETLTIPLRNFLCDIRLPLSLEDSRILVWNDLPDQLRDQIRTVTESEYDFVLQMQSRIQEEPRCTMDRALTVFKLFKDSLVLSNYVFVGTMKHDTLPHYTHWIDEHRGVPEYRLSQSEENEFVRFWKEFIELPQSRDINQIVLLGFD